MSKILDGGCILYEFRPKPDSAPKRWRDMTDEEALLASGFAAVAELRHIPLARAMANKGLRNDKITDKQGRAIYAIAKRYGVTVNDGYEVIAALRETSAHLGFKVPPDLWLRVEQDDLVVIEAGQKRAK